MTLWRWWNRLMGNPTCDMSNPPDHYQHPEPRTYGAWK